MGPRRIDRETRPSGGMKLPFRGHRTARCAVLPRRACDALLQCAERRCRRRSASARRQGASTSWREMLGVGARHLCPLRRGPHSARRCDRRARAGASCRIAERSPDFGLERDRVWAHHSCDDRQGERCDGCNDSCDFRWRGTARDDRGRPARRPRDERGDALAAPRAATGGRPCATPKVLSPSATARSSARGCAGAGGRSTRRSAWSSSRPPARAGASAIG